jgi:2-oxoglutarate/2-oxoacid ferredoxin oxidoreductase subunit beta
VVTGILHLDPDAPDMHDVAGAVDEPLVDLPFEALCPGSKALDDLQARYR